jgi:hypothetical protein
MRSELRAPFASRLALSVFVVLVAGGCSSPESHDSQDEPADTPSPEAVQCISGHPAAEPFDVGDVTVASAAPMSGAVAPAPPTLDTFTAECHSDGGTDCDESFMSKEAARCIAQSLAFDPGLDAWGIAMTYNYSYSRVVWAIENLLEDRGADGYSGESLTLDATLGTVLGRTSWHAAQ